MTTFRKERLASLVREIVSEMISCELQDPRISTLTTVTRVEMSPDLQLAKVYLSVQGELKAERRTLDAVQHAAGFIQRRLARELTIRSCPQLRFAIDDRLKTATDTLRIIAENSRQDAAADDGDDPSTPNTADEAATQGYLQEEKESRE